MKRVRNILSYSVLCTILLSCTGGEDVSDVMDGKGMDLVFSVGTMTESTRQSLDVIQAAGQPFRGLQTLTILPFRTNGAVSSENSPLLLPATGTETANRVTGQYYYYVGDCAMMKGTNRILAYAQAAPVDGKESSLQNGKVETTLAKRMSPADIMFSLSPICESTDANQAALDLAAYLTAIANTPGWSTTDDGAMKALYVDFIHTDAEETGLMAGSAANVKAYVAELDHCRMSVDDRGRVQPEHRTLVRQDRSGRQRQHRHRLPLHDQAVHGEYQPGHPADQLHRHGNGWRGTRLLAR